MSKSSLIWLLVTVLLITVSPAQAQQPKKVSRVSWLGTTSLSANRDRVEAFQQGLRELGYMDGKNIVMEYRFAEGKRDRMSELTAELVRLKVDVIVTGGSGATRPAKEATSTIPIVMTNEPDPVGQGFVASLAQPGGNITGLTTLASELTGKRLELLKEVVPGLSRVTVLGASTNAGNPLAIKEVEAAARALGVQLQQLDVVKPKDIETSFQAASKARADAVILLPGGVFVSNRTLVADLAIKSRLPAIYHRSDFVEDGGLMSYSTNLADLARRAATFVDKILKGAKPEDLPVEQPMKFEFVVNLKTAKLIGLVIPPNVLVRADRVIR